MRVFDRKKLTFHFLLSLFSGFADRVSLPPHLSQMLKTQKSKSTWFPVWVLFYLCVARKTKSRYDNFWQWMYTGKVKAKLNAVQQSHRIKKPSIAIELVTILGSGSCIFSLTIVAIDSGHDSTQHSAIGIMIAFFRLLFSRYMAIQQMHDSVFSATQSGRQIIITTQAFRMQTQRNGFFVAIKHFETASLLIQARTPGEAETQVSHPVL